MERKPGKTKKTDMEIEYIFLSCMVVLTVAAQIMIKIGSQHIVLNSGIVNFVKSTLNIHIISALMLTFIAPMFYIMAISKIYLHVAFAFTGLNYPLVTICSYVFLKEKINKNHILGILLVFIGFILFSN